jgi:hypothetical protein
MPGSHDDLIRRYAEGPALLRKALEKVPKEALQWRPAPGKWSVHEVIVHCADSETNAHMRIRYLLGEADPVIIGYDQDAWARTFNYHALPLEPALATIEAVRANTVPLLRSLPESAWTKTGRHSEHASYGVEKWMAVYAEHLEVHARQIQRNVEAWNKVKSER